MFEKIFLTTVLTFVSVSLGCMARATGVNANQTEGSTRMSGYFVGVEEQETNTVVLFRSSAESARVAKCVLEDADSLDSENLAPGQPITINGYRSADREETLTNCIVR